jgi:hypothetical protein
MSLMRLLEDLVGFDYSFGLAAGIKWCLTPYEDVQ